MTPTCTISTEVLKQSSGEKNVLSRQDAIKKKKGIYMEKYNIDPMSHYTDNNTSREITDRNLEVKTIRLLKESIKKKNTE